MDRNRDQDKQKLNTLSEQTNETDDKHSLFISPSYQNRQNSHSETIRQIQENIKNLWTE